MDPLCADLDALFALTILWMSRDFDRLDVGAGLAVHGRLTFVRWPPGPPGERRRGVRARLEKGLSPSTAGDAAMRTALRDGVNAEKSRPQTALTAPSTTFVNPAGSGAVSAENAGFWIVPLRFSPVMEV
jgi:hypothetical protein